MTDDLERRLRTAFRGDHLPEASGALRAFLDRLPAEAQERSLSGRSVWLRGARPSLVAIGALAAVVIAAVVVGLNPSPISPPVPQVAQYDGGSFTFDYPEDWRVISRLQQFGHGPTVMAVVGIGAFDIGCVTTPSGMACNGAHWAVPPDGVVLAYYAGASGAGPRPQQSPSLGPGETLVEVGRRAAVMSRTANSVIWLFPGSPEYIEARWGAANAGQSRAEVEALIASWKWRVTSVNVVCESPIRMPPATLICEKAWMAAPAFVAGGNLTAFSVEVHSGNYCPPGTACPIGPARHGYVVFTFGTTRSGYVVFTAGGPARRSSIWVQVTSDAAGVVTVTSGLDPFPPTGPTH